jgi:hypothetical protein
MKSNLESAALAAQPPSLLRAKGSKSLFAGRIDGDPNIR